MRQNHKQTLTLPPAWRRAALLAMRGAALGASLAVFALLPGGAEADGLAPGIVVDPLSGVALGGMDPVSYFTGPEPQPGLSDYEYDWGGVPWYFASAADRDVFVRAPGVYAPQFGGHATQSLAEGFLSDGNPHFYRVVADRLYLFYSTADVGAFDAAPGPTLDAARRHWSAFGDRLSARLAR